MENDQETLMADFTRNGVFAAPAHLVEPHLDGLKWYHPRKVKAQIGQFLIDAYAFRCPKTKGDDLNLEAVLVAALLGIKFKDDVAFIGCTVRGQTLPLIMRKPGQVTMYAEPGITDDDRHILGVYEQQLQVFSQLTGVRAHFHADGSLIRAPFPEEPGCIHIFPGTRPPGEGNLRYLDHAFDLPLTRNDRAAPVFEPAAGRGVTDGDASGPLVQLIGSNIYFLAPVISTFKPGIGPVVFERLLSLAWRKLAETRRRPPAVKPARRSEVVKGLEKLVDDSVSYLRKELADVHAKIEEQQRYLAEWYRNKRDIEMMLNSCLTSSFMRDTLARLPDEYRKIRAEPDAAGLWIVDNGLHVETRPLTIVHQGRCYDVGAFVIRIGRRGAVSVWSEQPRHPQGVPHPHIAKDGGPCFGNATEVIAKAGADHRYHDVVTLVLRWLKYGYSPDTAEVKIEEWPFAGEPSPEELREIERDAQAAAERDDQAFVRTVETATAIEAEKAKGGDR